MPLIRGTDEPPDDYEEMRGLFLEKVNDGVYRRKGAWRVGGYYSKPEIYRIMAKMINMYWAEQAEKEAYREAAGLNEGEFASLWDGKAYILKLI
jgi:hypothetical protein